MDNPFLDEFKLPDYPSPLGSHPPQSRAGDQVPLSRISEEPTPGTVFLPPDINTEHDSARSPATKPVVTDDKQPPKAKSFVIQERKFYLPVIGFLIIVIILMGVGLHIQGEEKSGRQLKTTSNSTEMTETHVPAGTSETEVVTNQVPATIRKTRVVETQGSTAIHETASRIVTAIQTQATNIQTVTFTNIDHGSSAIITDEFSTYSPIATITLSPEPSSSRSVETTGTVVAETTTSQASQQSSTSDETSSTAHTTSSKTTTAPRMHHDGGFGALHGFIVSKLHNRTVQYKSPRGDMGHIFKAFEIRIVTTMPDPDYGRERH